MARVRPANAALWLSPVRASAHSSLRTHTYTTTPPPSSLRWPALLNASDTIPVGWGGTSEGNVTWVENLWIVGDVLYSHL